MQTRNQAWQAASAKAKIIHTDKWVDAQEMHRQHPDTFEVPTWPALRNIDKGYGVKICNKRERFWTLVLAAKGNTVLATVDNFLVFSDECGYSYGDVVEYELKHVYEIQKYSSE